MGSPGTTGSFTAPCWSPNRTSGWAHGTNPGHAENGPEWPPCGGGGYTATAGEGFGLDKASARMFEAAEVVIERRDLRMPLAELPFGDAERAPVTAFSFVEMAA